MRSRLRDHALACAGAALGISTMAWLGLSNWAWTDYDAEARPAFDALLGGHFVGFLKLAPGYGGSLLMRAPFVIVPKLLWGGGELSTFRAAAAPCLAASAILGVWLVARMRAMGRPWPARVIVLFLCVANPITMSALTYGQPEELLGAVLCVAAVLVAMRGRPVWAGVLLGLAIANKDWALVAVGPVLLALPEHRARSLLVAGGVAAALMAPFVIAGSSGTTLSGAAIHTGTISNPWQLWWFLGTHSHLVRNTSGHVMVGYRAPPGWVGEIAHPLIVAVTVPLTLLCFWVRRRGGRPARNGDALLLLVLFLLLRCALDPWDMAYYPLPFLIALLVWETMTHERPPVLALAGSFAAWFVLQKAAQPSLGISADMQSLIFLAVTVPAVIAIAVSLYAPGLAERLTFRVRRRAALPSPA